MHVQKELSEFLNIPMADTYGGVTFYSRFSLGPQGKYKISVCLGTACFVKGSQKIMDRLTDRLKIEPGQTTKDRIIYNRTNKMCWSMWFSTSFYYKW